MDFLQASGTGWLWELFVPEIGRDLCGSLLLLSPGCQVPILTGWPKDLALVMLRFFWMTLISVWFNPKAHNPQKQEQALNKSCSVLKLSLSSGSSACFCISKSYDLAWIRGSIFWIPAPWEMPENPENALETLNLCLLVAYGLFKE